MIYKYLLCVVLGQATDAEAPVELDHKEIGTLATGEGPARQKVLHKYHDRWVKLTGKMTATEGGFLLTIAATKPTKATVRIPVKFSEPATGDKMKKAVQQNERGRRDTIVTLVGRAVFMTQIEQPADDYVIPDELKSRNKQAARVGSLQQTQDRIQRGVIEDQERQRKILEDAKSKGKLVTVPQYGIYQVREARTAPHTGPPQKGQIKGPGL